MSSLSNLEKEFKKALDVFGTEINSKLEIANLAMQDKAHHVDAVKALNEAVVLACLHGIPFHTNVFAMNDRFVMNIENHYIPETYFSKFSDLDPNKVSKMTNVASFALYRKDVEDDYDGDYDDEEYDYDDDDDDDDDYDDEDDDW